MNVFVKKDKFGLQWSDTINSNYRNFDNHVKNYSDIIQYFTDGRHQRIRNGKFDPPASIQFVDKQNRPYKHFSVRKIGDYWTASVDLDDKRIISFTDQDLFPMSDRKQFFSETDEGIPTDSEKNLLEYAEENYPAQVNLYRKIYAERTDKYSAKSYLESLSENKFSQPAEIEFL